MVFGTDLKKGRAVSSGYEVDANHTSPLDPPTMTPYLTDAFSSSRSLFEILIDLLGSEQTDSLDTAGIEAFLTKEGQVLLRQMFQDHLDLRAAEEAQTIGPMRAADGEMRTEIRASQRALETTLGEVTVSRKTLTLRGQPGGLRPLDAHLNLPAGRYSAPLVRLLAWEVAQSSYTNAIDSLTRTTAAQLPRRQAQRIVKDTVIDFEDFYLQRTYETDNDDRLMILTTDASGVVMRPEALREDTRKRAAGERRRSTAETSASSGQRGTTKNRKRMAQVASVYDLRAQPRTPTGHPRPPAEAGTSPPTTQSRKQARMGEPGSRCCRCHR
jgi:hypothetical protein